MPTFADFMNNIFEKPLHTDILFPGNVGLPKPVFKRGRTEPAQPPQRGRAPPKDRRIGFRDPSVSVPIRLPIPPTLPTTTNRQPILPPRPPLKKLKPPTSTPKKPILPPRPPFKKLHPPKPKSPVITPIETKKPTVEMQPVQTPKQLPNWINRSTPTQSPNLIKQSEDYTKQKEEPVKEEKRKRGKEQPFTIINLRAQAHQETNFVSSDFNV